MLFVFSYEKVEKFKFTIGKCVYLLDVCLVEGASSKAFVLNERFRKETITTKRINTKKVNSSSVGETSELKIMDRNKSGTMIYLYGFHQGGWHHNQEMESILKRISINAQVLCSMEFLQPRQSQPSDLDTPTRATSSRMS